MGYGICPFQAWSILTLTLSSILSLLLKTVTDEQVKDSLTLEATVRRKLRLQGSVLIRPLLTLTYSEMSSDIIFIAMLTYSNVTCFL